MNIGILGTGSIGLLLASQLSASGQPPLCLVRPQASGLAQSGIAIQQDARQWHFYPRTSTSMSDLLACDVILLCVKAWQAETAAQELHQAGLPLQTKKGNAATQASDTAGHPLLVSLMNGLHPEQAFVDRFGAEQVSAGLSYAAANRPSPERLHIVSLGPTMLPLREDKSREILEQLCQQLTKAGLSCQIEEQFARYSWTKLAINAAINPLAALHAVPNGILLERPEIYTQAKAVLAETLAVAATQGVSLDIDALEQRLIQTCRATAANRCSMLADLDAGRTTEIQWLNGAIARLGQSHSIDITVNKQLYAAISERTA